MPCPGTIHTAVGLVLLVFLKHGQGAAVEFRVGSVRIERSHATNGKTTAAVADPDEKLAQVLEEFDVVRNGVAVRQDPVGIAQVEVDE